MLRLFLGLTQPTALRFRSIMLEYEIKNWQVYQHYKTGDRNPPWIKLHNELMTSKDWLKYDDDSKLLAVVCMMIASRHKGIIEDDLDYIQQVAHLRKKPNLKPLIDSEFLVPCKHTLASASTAQASAIIEEKRREEKREEKEVEIPTWLDIQLWKDFKQHRKDIKKPMSLLAEKRIVTKITQLKDKGYDWKERVEYSIRSGYPDIYEPNATNKPSGRQNNKQFETEAQRRQRLSNAGK